MCAHFGRLSLAATHTQRLAVRARACVQLIPRHSSHRSHRLCMAGLGLALGLGAAAAWPSSCEEERCTPPASPWRAVYARAAPAVCKVAVHMVHPWTGQTEEVAGGSGFAIREDGVIMSNAHVVHPPGMPVQRVSYTVHFDDGRCYQAKLIGADRLSDIAVLQAVPANPGDRWAALKFAAAGSAAPGDAVAALGCPFGGRLAISTGVVSSQYYVADDSGLASVMPAGMLSTALMQFDSPIVSGNSGGPIVNACGEVVGIAAMSKNSVRESVYLGITAEHANAIAGQLLSQGKVQRPLLGVRVMNFDRVRWAQVAAQMRQSSALGVAPAGPPANVHHGLLVMEVAPASPAFTAGLQPRDVIIGVNGHPAGTKGDLYAAVGPVYVQGHKLTVDVIRGQQRLQLTVVPTCRG